MSFMDGIFFILQNMFGKNYELFELIFYSIDEV